MSFATAEPALLALGISHDSHVTRAVGVTNAAIVC